MYRELRDCYGVPKLHYRGVHGDFYVMVRIRFMLQQCRASQCLWRFLPDTRGGGGSLIRRSEHEEKSA